MERCNMTAKKDSEAQKKSYNSNEKERWNSTTYPAAEMMKDTINLIRRGSIDGAACFLRC